MKTSCRKKQMDSPGKSNDISFKNTVCLVLLGVILALSLAGCQTGGQISENPPPAVPGPMPESPLPSEPEYVDITIASVGDILIHNTLYYAAYQPNSDSYNFNEQFHHVRPYLEDADIAIANLETTLAGPEHGYSSYPKFNTPDSIVDALREAGIDILTAANNHRMDTGVSGFYRTIQVVREKGLDLIGVKAEQQEETYVIKEIQGVKTAFLNFGYAYPQWDGSLSINGLILPASMRNLVAFFDPQDLERSMPAIEEQFNKVKRAGAEIIVVCLHWGDEYHRFPNDFQKELASNLAALGADVIFGGHPHVLQPAVFLSSPEGKKVPVFYSQGNFISDQRKETVDDIYTEQGIIAKVTFRVKKPQDPETINGKPEPPDVEMTGAETIPTWVNKKMINNRFFYEVIPVQDALNSPEKFPRLDVNDLERIRFCQDTVAQVSEGLQN